MGGGVGLWCNRVGEYCMGEDVEGMWIDFWRESLVFRE
jgi:hypothetical protein